MEPINLDNSGWITARIKNQSGTIHLSSVYFYPGMHDYRWFKHASCGTPISSPAETTDEPVTCKRCNL